ncbi:MAG: hypothetical protein AAB571_00425 [Chloroflexota bacterium]
MTVSNQQIETPILRQVIRPFIPQENKTDLFMAGYTQLPRGYKDKLPTSGSATGTFALYEVGALLEYSARYNFWGTPTYIESVSPLAQSFWAKVVNGYSLQQPETIASFLRRHYAVGKVLADALDQLPVYFGQQPKVSLELKVDPEYPSDKQLFAYIHTELPVEEALSRFEQFDESWLLARLAGLGGTFNFNLRFL